MSVHDGPEYAPTVHTQEIADLLKSGNIRSVNSRYKESTSITPVDLSTFSYDELGTVTIGLFLKQLDFIEYQSCESSDFRDSVGFHLINKMRGYAISSLPDYDTAPWGL